MSQQPQLRCIGSGDAFGSGGRLNSCYHLDTGEGQLLLDCGCSSLIGLQRYGPEPAAIDAVVVSHLHGDHFGGLPFLILEAKYASQRRRPLTLIGPAGLQQQVEAALEALYPGTVDPQALEFPLHYLTLEEGKSLAVAGGQLDCCRVKHGNSPEVYALQVAVADKRLCYTGDTEWTDKLIPFVSGSDLLIAECFAYAEAVPSHLDYQTLLRQRDKLNCRRLLLTHPGPEMLAKLDRVELEVLNDGDLIQL